MRFPTAAFLSLAAAAPSLLLAAPASAAPLFLPDRDVAVTYQLAAPGRAPQEYRLQYNAAAGLARIETPAQGIFVLADLPAGQAQIVVPFLHAFVQAPDFSDLTRMIAHADGARFTPLGHGHYAGMGCEKYLVMNAQGSGTACITHDGVVLHFAGRDSHGTAEVTALAVDFTPEPSGTFATPNGFSEISLPPGALAALLQPQ
jgi:hypothetical protein